MEMENDMEMENGKNIKPLTKVAEVSIAKTKINVVSNAGIGDDGAVPPPQAPAGNFPV